jgi:DNA-binding phage protein
MSNHFLSSKVPNKAVLKDGAFTQIFGKSLHRMLSAKGNPTMENLTAIFNILRKKLKVDLEVKTISCH